MNCKSDKNYCHAGNDTCISVEYGYCSISESNQNSSFNMTVIKSQNNLHLSFCWRQSIDTFFKIRWKTKDLHNVENRVSKFDRVQASSPLCHWGMYIQTETTKTGTLCIYCTRTKAWLLSHSIFSYFNISHWQQITLAHCLQIPPTLQSECPSTL